MGSARRGEGHDSVGACGQPGLFFLRIAVGSRREVNRDYWPIYFIHLSDCFGVKSGNRRPEAGTQDPIHQDIGMKRLSRTFTFQFLALANEDRSEWKFGEHLERVAMELGTVGEQHRPDFTARFVQFAGGDQTIAAVVAFPTYDSESFCVRAA